MTMTRTGRASAILLVALLLGAIVTAAPAMATELGDYRWQSRPLLLFAPTDRDPRLVETLRRIDATRCDFEGRDMVVGQIVAQGSSTLDGRALGAEESRSLARQFGVGGDEFSAILIGKDGGEKLRIDDVPDLRRIYQVVDGMPMRSRETGGASSGC